MVFAFLLARFKHVLEFCGTINVVAMRADLYQALT